MVDDVVFLIVLGILIAVVAVFVAFLLFIKKMMPSPLMMKVASTLHATLFGYESAMMELIGPRGYKQHVFPSIVETIKKIQKESPVIEEAVKAKDAKAAMDGWMEVLNTVKVCEGGKVIDNGNGEYIIDFAKCAMVGDIHDIMGGSKGICPNALTVIAASALSEPNKVPDIQYSELTRTGSVTKFTFKEE